MTGEQIDDVVTLAFRRFYARPKFIFRLLLEVRSWYDFTTVLKGGTSFFWLWVKRDSLKVDRPAETAGSTAKTDKN